MNVDLSALVHGAVLSLAYGAIGVLLFGFAIWLISRVTPFSIRKEIEEDQNVAVGIVVAAVILGLALIVAASVHG